jgi:hypothetical protein
LDKEIIKIFYIGLIFNILYRYQSYLADLLTNKASLFIIGFILCFFVNKPGKFSLEKLVLIVLSTRFFLAGGSNYPLLLGILIVGLFVFKSPIYYLFMALAWFYMENSIYHFVTSDINGKTHNYAGYALLFSLFIYPRNLCRRYNLLKQMLAMGYFYSFCAKFYMSGEFINYFNNDLTNLITAAVVSNANILPVSVLKILPEWSVNLMMIFSLIIELSWVSAFFIKGIKIRYLILLTAGMHVMIWLTSGILFSVWISILLLLLVYDKAVTSNTNSCLVNRC